MQHGPDRPTLCQKITKIVLSGTGNIRTTFDAGEDRLEVSVADTGPGIPLKRLARVFEPYYTTKANGLGLGLSISYRIVADHDGAIEASSEGMGKGSQFRLTLPLVQREEKYEKQIQAA